MKIIAFNGSPHHNGNTAKSIMLLAEELSKYDVDTEVVQVGGIPLRGCMACFACYKNRSSKCVITTDPVNDWIEKIMAADGIILASPVYFHNVTSEMKAFIDRVGFVARSNGRMFNQKIGTAIATVRRQGAIPTLDAMISFFMSMQMYVVGGPNVIISSKPDELHKDAEGVQNLTKLAHDLAFICKLKAQHSNNQK